MVSETTGAPAGVDALRTFINTRNVETGTDLLGSAEAATDWLRERGWLGSGEGMTDEDLVRLIRLREALRALTLEHAGHGSAGDAETLINQIARQARLVVELDEGRPTLVPAESGFEGAVGVLLAILHETVVTGEWPRLKACGNDACQWAYYDRSRNASRRWCDSQGCGNLMAARAYRTRQRAERGDG